MLLRLDPGSCRPKLPLHGSAASRAIEQAALAHLPPHRLMQRAAASIAALARALQPHARHVWLACGPGNNGGDGFVMARQLAQAGREVVVAFCATADRLPAEAAKAHADYFAAGGTIVSDLPAAPAQGWALVVDALFGIGLGRPIDGRYASWIQTLNAQPGPRMALDVPSGLNADTGQPLGTTFRATHTTTFIALKPGLLVQIAKPNAHAHCPGATSRCA